MNSCFPPSYGKIAGKTGFFSLGLATSLIKEKLWIPTSFSPLNKLTLYHILLVAERLGKYTHWLLKHWYFNKVWNAPLFKMIVKIPLCHWLKLTQGQFLSRVWILSFPSPRLFALTRLKKLSLGWRRDGSVPFSMALAWSEMQTVSSRI